MESGNSRKKTVIVFVIALVVCIVAAIYVAYTLYTRFQEDKEYDNLKETVSIEEIQSAEFTGQREGEAPDLPEDILVDGQTNPIDFERLQTYNDELVAWIKVPGTNIDYPVARHEGEDQSYYLNYNMYRETAYAGCIYMENVNAADFSDNNTVLYGHNMKTKSMFGNLHKFEEKEFFDENQYIFVYTPGHALTYQIFAAYVTDNTKLTKAYDFSDQDVYERYLKNVLDVRSMSANLREGVEVTGSDRIITLSTCIYGQTSKRYLVQGVLMKDVETGKED